MRCNYVIVDLFCLSFDIMPMNPPGIWFEGSSSKFGGIRFRHVGDVVGLLPVLEIFGNAQFWWDSQFCIASACVWDPHCPFSTQVSQLGGGDLEATLDNVLTALRGQAGVPWPWHHLQISLKRCQVKLEDAAKAAATCKTLLNQCLVRMLRIYIACFECLG